MTWLQCSNPTPGGSFKGRIYRPFGIDHNGNGKGVERITRNLVGYRQCQAEHYPRYGLKAVKSL